VQKEKSITLSYYPLERPSGEVFLAERPEEEILEGLRIAVFEDKWVPDDKEDPEPTGLKQVHLMGTPEALQEFGRYLIAISESELPEDEIDHFEPIKGAKNDNEVHLIVHHKHRDEFGETIRISSFIPMTVDEEEDG
jgi:hypothetical protein